MKAVMKVPRYFIKSRKSIFMTQICRTKQFLFQASTYCDECTKPTGINIFCSRSLNLFENLSILFNVFIIFLILWFQRVRRVNLRIHESTRFEYSTFSYFVGTINSKKLVQPFCSTFKFLEFWYQVSVST